MRKAPLLALALLLVLLAPQAVRADPPAFEPIPYTFTCSDFTGWDNDGFTVNSGSWYKYNGNAEVNSSDPIFYLPYGSTEPSWANFSYYQQKTSYSLYAYAYFRIYDNYNASSAGKMDNGFEFVTPLSGDTDNFKWTIYKDGVAVSQATSYASNKLGNTTCALSLTRVNDTHVEAYASAYGYSYTLTAEADLPEDLYISVSTALTYGIFNEHRVYSITYSKDPIIDTFTCAREDLGTTIANVVFNVTAVTFEFLIDTFEFTMSCAQQAIATFVAFMYAFEGTLSSIIITVQSQYIAFINFLVSVCCPGGGGGEGGQGYYFISTAVNLIVVLVILLVPTMILREHVGEVATIPSLGLMWIVCYIANLVPIQIFFVGVVAIVALIFRDSIKRRMA